ncbi:MAG: hypothetical protein ACK559_38445, partial [bacterium]
MKLVGDSGVHDRRPATQHAVEHVPLAHGAAARRRGHVEGVEIHLVVGVAPGAAQIDHSEAVDHELHRAGAHFEVEEFPVGGDARRHGDRERLADLHGAAGDVQPVLDGVHHREPVER